jgi:hypothetical protein
MNAGDRRPLVPPMHEDVALLAAYLLSCGRGLMDEPPDYGVLRCADGARRALAILEDNGVDNRRLSAVRVRLDDIFYAPMEGEKFLNIGRTLDELCEEMAAALQEMSSS